MKRSHLVWLIYTCYHTRCCGCPMQVKVIQSDMRKRAREEISFFRIYNCKCDQVCTKVRPIGTVSHYSGNTPLVSLVASQHLCCKLSGLASSVAALHLAFPALTFMHCYGSLAGQTLPHLRVWPARPFYFLAVWE